MSEQVYGTQNTVSSSYFKPYVLTNATRISKLEYIDSGPQPYLEITMTRDSDGATIRDRLYQPEVKTAFKGKTKQESENFLIQKMNTWLKELLSLHLKPEDVAKVSGTSFKSYMYAVIAAMEPKIANPEKAPLFWWKPVKSSKGYTKISQEVPNAFYKDIGQDVSQVPLTFTKHDYKYQHISPTKNESNDESQEMDPEADERYASSDNDVNDRY